MDLWDALFPAWREKTASAETPEHLWVVEYRPKQLPMPIYQYQQMVPSTDGCKPLELSTPRGCICPPGSEKTCQGKCCPRQSPKGSPNDR